MAEDQSPPFTPKAQIVVTNQMQIIQPPNQLITTKLSESNYLVWKQQILTAVCGYGLDGFLDGSHPAPTKFIAGTINPDYLQWHRQDQLLSSWLQSTLSEGMHIQIVGLENSRDIWDALELSFASQTKAKIMQYKLQLQTLKKGNLSMREYLNQIKYCCDILGAAGQKINEDDQILHVLSGLGSEYNPVMVSITTKSEACTMREVCALLLSFENRLEEASNSNSMRQGGSFNSSGTSRGRGRANNRPRCQVCQRVGHTADKCYYRFDPNYGLANNNASSSTVNGSYNYETPDSGASATKNVTYDFNNLNMTSDYQGANKLQVGNRTGPSNRDNSS